MIGGMGNLLFKEAYIYAQMRDKKIPDIYLQDEKYFENHKQEIKDRFSEGIGFMPFTSIHIRRGDYLMSYFHTHLWDTDYYERAITRMPRGTNFLVFSDDPEYCKENFKGKHFQVMEKTDEVHDFNLMASCENNIIANSSFSWWAAYLNPNPAKRIIAPREDMWFSDRIIRIKLPDNYEQI